MSDQPQNTPQQAPAAPAAPSQSAQPEGWAPGAYQRFKEMGAELDRYRQEVQAKAAEAQSWQAKYGELQTRASQDLVMARAGGQFGHPSVQRAIRNEYAEYSREAGDKAKAFDAWFSDPDTQANPLIGGFFKQAQPAQQPAAPPPQPEPPKAEPVRNPPPASPNVGAREPQAPPPRDVQPGEWQRVMSALPRGPGAKLPAEYKQRITDTIKR